MEWSVRAPAASRHCLARQHCRALPAHRLPCQLVSPRMASRRRASSRGVRCDAPGALLGTLRRDAAPRTPRDRASRTVRTDTGRDTSEACASVVLALHPSLADTLLRSCDANFSEKACALAKRVSVSEELFTLSSITLSSTSSRNGWSSFSLCIVALMTSSAFSRSPKLSMKKTMGEISLLSSCHSTQTYKVLIYPVGLYVWENEMV
jgi:hypothetical protein